MLQKKTHPSLLSMAHCLFKIQFDKNSISKHFSETRLLSKVRFAPIVSAYAEMKAKVGSV